MRKRLKNEKLERKLKGSVNIYSLVTIYVKDFSDPLKDYRFLIILIGILGNHHLGF